MRGQRTPWRAGLMLLCGKRPDGPAVTAIGKRQPAAPQPRCRPEIYAPDPVYVDNDPVVVAHAAALLAAGGTTAIHGDLTRPGAILATPRYGD
ncbi:MAG: SAM-dependent methyltransferase [Streptosporangiaceae bacterium]|nr:SAM-dependent methyltransferase [Streptosporangiaceae bacterium]